MDKSFKNPSVTYNFPDSFDKGLHVTGVGYDDFNYVKPYKVPRILSSRYVIHYVFSGSGKLFIEDNVYQVKAKQFFFLPAGSKLYYYPNENDKWTYFWLTFSGDNAVDFVNTLSIGKKNPVVSAPDDLSEAELFAFAQEISNKKQVNYYKAKSMLYLIADALCKTQQTGGFINSLVKDAKEMIKLNYDNREFTVDLIANELHVSHSYLVKVFKQKTGKTLVEYLIDIRLAAAIDMLVNTNLTARQISYNVGYNDEIHFLKQFKKKYGLTTKEYRQKNGR